MYEVVTGAGFETFLQNQVQKIMYLIKTPHPESGYSNWLLEGQEAKGLDAGTLVAFSAVFVMHGELYYVLQRSVNADEEDVGIIRKCIRSLQVPEKAEKIYSCYDSQLAVMMKYANETGAPLVFLAFVKKDDELSTHIFHPAPLSTGTALEVLQRLAVEAEVQELSRRN